MTNWRMESNPGVMRIQNRSVADLIKYAFDLKTDSQILNAPSWVSSQHFDIDGKEDEVLGKTLETCPLAQRIALLHQLVRSLLEQRFNLQQQARTIDTPVFALVLAKGGAKITLSKPKDGKGFRGLVGPAGKIDAHGATMQLLADRLSRAPESAGRVVIDKTGLTAEYDWSLSWTPDAGMNEDQPATAGSPSLFTALQEQLGLKLESQKGSVPAVFLQSVSQPSEN